MNNVEELTKELAKACREKGLNFVIAIEENGIHSQSSVNGKSELRKLVNLLKTIIKK